MVFDRDLFGHETERNSTGIPRIIYHGSNESYVYTQFLFLDTLKGIYATDEYSDAYGYAIKRAKQYEDSPLVLIIDTYKLPIKPFWEANIPGSNIIVFEVPEASCFWHRPLLKHSQKPNTVDRDYAKDKTKRKILENRLIETEMERIKYRRNSIQSLRMDHAFSRDKKSRYFFSKPKQ